MNTRRARISGSPEREQPAPNSLYNPRPTTYPSEMSLTAPEILRIEYEERRARNPRFSMRAFSKQLGFSSGRLSEFLSGKRPLRERQARAISEKLALSPERHTKLLESTQTRATALPAFKQVHQDEFLLISSWHHFAILSLMDLPKAQAKSGWIARRLGIPKAEAREALLRLRRLGILEIDAEGKPRKKHANLCSTDQLRNLSLRRSHEELLEKAREVLFNTRTEDRDYSAMTLTLARRDLKVAKEMIRDFRRTLTARLEATPGEEVYSLQIQLYPLTRLKETL